jgi:hypothetical protein
LFDHRENNNLKRKKKRALVLIESNSMDSFTFGTNGQTTWGTTGSDGVAIAAPSPTETRHDHWDEWMQWNTSTQVDPHKTGNLQSPLGALGPLKSASTRSPLLSRRHNAQLQNATLGLPTEHAHSVLATTQASPFTFGESADNHSFSFKNSPFASPPVATPLTTPSQASQFFSADQTWDENRQAQPSRSPPNPSQHASVRSAVAAQSAPSLQQSPSSLTNGRTDPSDQSSPEPRTASKSKKRKASDVSDEQQDDDKPPVIKKTAHNMIEKRYRTNLNDKIAALRDSVPSLRVISRNTQGSIDEDDPEDLEGLTPAHKLNKATVLSKATEYIHHLEKRVKQLTDELADSKNRIKNYNKLAMAGPVTLPRNVTTPDGLAFQEDPFTSVSMPAQTISAAPPQGMIPVPDNIASLHRAAQNQQHYAHQQVSAPPGSGYPMYTSGPGRPNMHPQPHLANGRRVVGSNIMGKLMVGSLAGLMIMEGWSQREQSTDEPNGRGLLALPVSLFSKGHSSFNSSHALFPLFRMFILLVACGYLVYPLIHMRPTKKKQVPSGLRLAAAPSLASPVEVRRKAWLTAIQTVWVPQHSFFLEAAALGLKTLKLSTRKLIGWHGYAFLTGITKEQEAARVKAWEIALDAQLTGGDAEISNSRLLLTLMASGTLPDTPARLMLKALHVRILLWGIGKAGYGTMFMFEELSAKIARHYWNRAREEHQVLATRKDVAEGERLAPHLAVLVELDCDEVLENNIVRRAFNVAWNKSNGQRTAADVGLDSVVEDLAISSPLDALAAWWSSTVLSQVLISYLSKPMTLDQDASALLDLAIETSPPNSYAQLRALTAKALLVDEGREENLKAAIAAVPVKAHVLTPMAESPTLMTQFDSQIISDVKRTLAIANWLDVVSRSCEEDRGSKDRKCHIPNLHHGPGLNLTLLSFTAAFKLVFDFSQDQEMLVHNAHGIERYAIAVRLWAGRDTGRKSGMTSKTLENIIGRCLRISKTLVGMGEDADDIDHGYVSGSEPNSPLS